MRVHELAKELQTESKQLIAVLTDMGISVKSHMGSLTDEQTEAVRKKYAEDGNLQQPAKKPPAPKKKSAKPKPKPEPTPEPESIPETKVLVKEAEGESPKTVIEQRVSRTVIRRRKKTEPEPEAAVAQEEAPEVEEPQPGTAPEDQTAVTASPEAVTVEAETGQAAAPGADEPIPAETAATPEAETEAAPAPVIKKLRITEKESTPARIIDRIDLGQRTVAREPKQAEASTPAREAAAGRATVPKVTPESEDRDGKRIFAKDKQKPKKFLWQQASIDEDDVERAPSRQKRVRYKVKDKGTRTKKGKTELVSLSAKGTEKTVPKAIKRKIKIHKGITVAELAKRMGVKAGELIKKLITLGVMATMNQLLDNDTAALVAGDFGYEIETVSVEEETIFEQDTEESAADLQPRCPVVTVMGHVDHGKTSLLDAIRNTKVVDGEAGGITQHIGAYRVSLPGGDIAFVDTPGHAAFTTMRARGAQVTDIVIIVVAAEEGVMPQTLEAISHAQAAGVPIIVAVNKIDKPEANPERIRQELSQRGLVSEEWGGDILFADISAKQNIGIDKLLDMVLLQAEMLELKANPDKPARGTIVEARLDRGRGPIATVLVQEGTLKAGDSFVSRHNFGKVRALIDDHGKTIKEAGPSTPVEILGFSSVPEAGDVFIVVDERKARQVSTHWQQKKRDEALRKDARVSLENFMKGAGEDEVKNLCVIIKADVQGSVEAVKQSLENLNTDKVKVTVLHHSVGAISLNDVMLASASNAIIIGFGVKTEPKVHETAEAEGIEIRQYDIIYEIIDEVRKAMVGLLAPKYVERMSGKAEIRQAFDISKYGKVAGCFVLEGKVINGSKARVRRNGETIYEGEITSLKRFKDDAREVLSGQDCGIFLGNYKAFQEGDIIESYSLEEVEQTLE